MAQRQTSRSGQVPGRLPGELFDRAYDDEADEGVDASDIDTPWSVAEQTVERRGRAVPFGNLADVERQVEAQKLRAPGNLTVRAWVQLCSAFEQRCAYCGQQRKLCIEHVMRVAESGRTDLENVLPACQECNARKRGWSGIGWLSPEHQGQFWERYVGAFGRFYGEEANDGR
jgi:HNH endonuclease